MKSSFYVYCTLPYFIWNYVYKKRFIVSEANKLMRRHRRLAKTGAVCSLLILFGVWTLVLSFFRRSALTGLLLFISFAFTKRSWKVLSVVLSVFPMLPVVGRLPNALLVVAG